MNRVRTVPSVTPKKAQDSVCPPGNGGRSLVAGNVNATTTLIQSNKQEW